MKTTFVPDGLDSDHDFNVVVGYPIMDAESLMGKPNLITECRFIPQILKDLGITKSLNQIKRDRPDLWVELPDGLAFFSICIGKESKFNVSKWVTILQGYKTIEQRDLHVQT